MIQKLPPTMMKISTAVKTMASRFSFGVEVKLSVPLSVAGGKT